MTTGDNTFVDVSNNFGTYMPGLNGTCQFLAEITTSTGGGDDFVSETRQENTGGAVGGGVGGFNCTDFDAFQCEAADPPTRSPSEMPTDEPSPSPVERPSFWEDYYDTPTPTALDESGATSSTHSVCRVVGVIVAVLFGTTVGTGYA